MSRAHPAEPDSREAAVRLSGVAPVAAQDGPRGIAVRALVALAGSLALGTVLAAPGELDNSFGDAGRARLGIYPLGAVYLSSDDINLAQQSSGRIIVASTGVDWNAGYQDVFVVVRLMADGQLDPGFGTGGLSTANFGSGFRGYGQAVVVQPDDKIVVAGYRSDSNTGELDLALARFEANGGLDPTFGNGGIVVFDALGSDEQIRAIVRQSDGSLVVAGVSNAGGQGDQALFARFDATGQIDPSFGSNGVLLVSFGPGGYSYANALAVQGDDTLVAAGQGPGGFTRTMVAFRLTADGELDTTFDSDGLAVADFGTNVAEARAVAVQADGRVVLGGYVSTGTGYRTGLARLNTNGSLDDSFGSGGTATPDLGPEWGDQQPLDMVQQADGRIVVVGNFYSASPASDLLVARFTDSGALDTEFGNGGIALADFGTRDQLSATYGSTVLRQSDGRLLAVGKSGIGDIDLARFDATAGTGSGGVLSFQQLQSYTNEAAGSITVAVRRTGGASGPISVSLRLTASNTSPVGAAVGCDFNFVTTTLSWAAGDYAEKTVTISIVNDTYLEFDDHFEFELFNPVGAALASLAHQVYISNDVDTTEPSRGLLDIEALKTVGEGDGAVTLQVTRSGTAVEDCAVAGWFTESYGGADAATPGLDFAAVSGALQFAEGETGSKTISVPIIDDTLGEMNERFYVFLNTNVTVVNDTAQVSIVDNDGGFAGTIAFSYQGNTDEESDGPAGGPIILSRLNGSNGPVTVDYTVTSGTATAGLDFVAQSGTIAWASGDATDKLIYVEILEDTLEESDETYLVTISNPTGGAVITGEATWTQTIRDNDTPYPGEFTVSSFSYQFEEDVGTAAAIVLRRNGRDGAVTVDYATTDGTATAGADYTAVGGTVSFADGEGCDRYGNCSSVYQKAVTIPITNDAAYEPADETFSFNLSNPTGGATLGSPASLTFTIRPSDSPNGLIALQASNPVVNETAGTVTLAVFRTEGTQGVVSVDFNTGPVTATPNVDYTNRSGTLTWAEGDSSAKQIEVPIINDSLVELTEQFYVQLTNVTGGALLGTRNLAYVYISDDESAAGQVAFSTSYGVPEDLDTFNITVYRQGGSSGAVSVDYTTVDGSATTPGDYLPASGTLTWANGETTTKIIPIDLVDDNVPEATEGFTVVFSNPTGGLLLPQNTVNVQVTDDDDPGTISMVQSAITVTEAGTTLTFTATRSGGTSGAVSVTWATVADTASAGGDYVAATGTLSWANLESGPKTFQVTLLDDAIEEDNETFAVRLSNPTNSAQLGVASTVVTIQDNDANPGILRFTVASRAVSEAAATVQVDVERFGGSLGAVSVQYATANGTAVAGLDYTAAGGTLDWAAGERTTRSFTVAITGETVFEPDETFTVTLSNPSGGAVLGTPAVQTITIENDDQPNGSLGMTVSSVSPTEGDEVVLQVSRSGGSYGVVSVGFTTLDGSATSPADFTATSGTLTWADGDTASKAITVATIDDLLDEPVESFTVSLSNPTGGAQLIAAGTTVNLKDNDLGPTGTIGMLQTTVSPFESSLAVSVLVARSGGASGPATVDYRTDDFTALAPDDYVAASGTLTWDDFDDSNKVITVTIVNDTLDEPDEAFNVVLSNATGAALNVAATTTAVTIRDDDLPPVPGTLSVLGPSSAGEAIGGATYTFRRSNGADGVVSVSYATVAGTATAGADFTAQSGTLTWASGDTTDKTVTVPIVDDALDEPGETFNMTITGPGGGASLGNASVTTTIVDNDVSGPGSVSFTAVASVFETAGSAILEVTRSNGFDGPISVKFATANGTALDGQDYTAVNGTLSWADGEGGSKLVTVPVLNDEVQEDPLETFTVTLSDATGGATITNPTATVTITDDDIPGTIGFAQTQLVSSEAAASVVLSVWRSIGTRGTVTVKYATVAGTAGAGTDFVPASGTFTWGDGDSTARTITINLLDDTLVEFDEQFTVVLSDPGGGATLGAATATVTLQSNEVPVPGTIRMASAAISVNEDAGPASVVVERTVGSDGPVSIDFRTVPGTATAADFTAVSGTLSWADGDAASQTIAVPISNDDLYEADETFAVLLSNPTPGAILADPSTTVTIVSEDLPRRGTIAMASATATVNEPAGTLTISVTRTGGSDGPVGVSFATSPGSATAADFTATSGTLAWADGDAAIKSITVPITDDTIFEPDESFTVTLSAPTGGATLGADGTVVTIINDDPAQQGRIEMASPAVSIGEAAGSVTIAVNRVSGSDGAVGVSFATAAGSAGDGTDFTGVSGTLAWADGDAAPKTITVPILDDTIFELDEAFTVKLSGATGGAALGGTTTTVTIVSDELPQGGTIAMATGAASVAEPDGTITLAVSRTGGADGTVSVNYASAPGTAGAADFSAVGGTLTWPNGDASDKTIVVPITDDAIYETDETFRVTLSGLTGQGATLGTAVTTVTITSDDPARPGTLAMAASAATVDEFAGTVTISVVRTGGADLPVGVSYATAPATAQSPGDFTATSGTLSWANGDAAAKSIVVPITNDTAFEPNETFTVTLSGATGGATLGAAVTTTVTIVSEDPPRRGTLALASAAETVNEPDGSITLTVTRTGGTDGAVDVRYATTAGTAAAADFTATSGTLSWDDGDATARSITVAITDDAVVELNEAFAVSLSNPTGGAVLGTASTTITIRDDDILVAPGVLALTETAVTVNETAGTATFTVTRVNGLGGQVSVRYATASGTAEAGADFTSASGTLSWPAGDAAPRTFTVSITDDTVFENAENFTVTLSNPDGGASLGNASTTVTVVSDDPPPDTTPDPFSFTDQRNMEPGAEVQSNAIAVTGINTPAPISITGGEYSVNGGAFTAQDGLVANGASVRVRVNASSEYDTTVSTTLTIGGVSDTFSVTTRTATTTVVVRAKGGGSFGLLGALLLGVLALGPRARRAVAVSVAGLALGLLVPTAQAQAQDAGLYFGAGGGLAEIDVSAKQLQRQVEEASGQVVTSVSVDESSASYYLRVGYAFNRWIALEWSYLEWGDDSARIEAEVIDPQAFIRTVAEEFPGNVSGPAVMARVGIPFAERWAVNLRAGAMFWDSEVEVDIVSGGSGRYRTNRTGEDLAFGAGLAWRVADRVAVELEYTRVELPDAVSSLQLGVTWLTGWR